MIVLSTRSPNPYCGCVYQCGASLVGAQKLVIVGKKNVTVTLKVTVTMNFTMNLERMPLRASPFQAARALIMIASLSSPSGWRFDA